jgi:hypothetical protein
LAGIADIIDSPDGASILVIGDGSGNQNDEWVSVWARDHLAEDATVSYSAWDRDAGEYADAVEVGSSDREVTVWNASVSAPDMATEPDRIAQAWQDADVVLLSYGHRQSADEITGQMDAVLAAVRAQRQERAGGGDDPEPRSREHGVSPESDHGGDQEVGGRRGLPHRRHLHRLHRRPSRPQRPGRAGRQPDAQGSDLWAKHLGAGVGRRVRPTLSGLAAAPNFRQPAPSLA